MKVEATLNGEDLANIISREFGFAKNLTITFYEENCDKPVEPVEIIAKCNWEKEVRM